MTNPIDLIGKEIAEEFELFGEWMEKYEYLIDLGKSLPLIDRSSGKISFSFIAKTAFTRSMLNATGVLMPSPSKIYQTVFLKMSVLR